MASKLKFILLGDSSVGKTALAKKWLRLENTAEMQSPTYGAGYFDNEVYVHNRMEKIQLWDTAGQEKYRSMANIYARDAIGVLLVFDLTSRSSFNNLRSWINSITSAKAPKYVCAGNKSDLEEKREISVEEALEFCQSLDIPYFETSALKGDNVDEAFFELVSSAIPNEQNVNKSNENDRNVFTASGNQQKPCCS